MIKETYILKSVDGHKNRWEGTKVINRSIKDTEMSCYLSGD